MLMKIFQKRIWIPVILLIIILFVVYQCHKGEYFTNSSYEPRILKGFVTEEDADYIKWIVMNEFKESVVGTTSYTKDHKIRKSETAWVNVKNEPRLQKS